MKTRAPWLNADRDAVAVRRVGERVSWPEAWEREMDDARSLTRSGLRGLWIGLALWTAAVGFAAGFFFFAGSALEKADEPRRYRPLVHEAVEVARP